MSRLVLTSVLLAELRTELLGTELESCAVLFGRPVVQNSRLVRIIIRDVIRPFAADYSKRTRIAAQLRPEFVASVTQRARQTGDSLVFVHTHPFAMNTFSEVDDAGEMALSEFLKSRMPKAIHAALLITPEAIVARVLGSTESLEVAGIGPQIIWGRPENPDSEDSTFDRQTRVFGANSQARLQKLQVGIVGLGGTGSIVAEQLAHLGVKRFLLIDPDTVEKTNLNRLVGAATEDIGKTKVGVASAQIKRINPSASVEKRVASVLLSKVAEELADTDFFFCCTDSQGSRAVLNQLAYQYLVPMIDMGAVIVAEKGRISHIAGRTQMLAPGLGCLVCGNLLDPEAVRVDLLTDFERNADPYIVGLREPAPAVISLNATMSSMAVTMFLASVVGVPSAARLINYNGIIGSSRAGIITPHPKCIVCSPTGAIARSNEWLLPARQS